MTDQETSSGQVFVRVGDIIRIYVADSEASTWMGVARKPMYVQIVGDQFPAAQLLNDDGSHFSFPIGLSEAGIQTTLDGRHWVPTRSLAPPRKLRVFIPEPTSTLPAAIDPGSAIVGEDNGQPDILVDYEGNRHGAANLNRYWQRAFQAASRHIARYPTTARMTVSREQLIPVGWWDIESQELTLDSSEQTSWALGQWLGLVGSSISDPAELHPSHQVTGNQLGSMENSL